MMNSASHDSVVPSMKRKTSYTRDFLLSLSDLEVCKRLPNGIDKSLVSEFEDAPQERFRTAGGLPFHNSRRNDYSSSPPTKGDTGSHSRAAHGRWDPRSSNAPNSDIETDSSKQNGNQSRRPWQVREQDGLLGSGSFPRPISGASSKVRSGDNYQTNKATEAYNPPKPYKAAPYSRRESNDSFNDETFSFSENASEDTVEEERKRRAAFELMRKEQHKSLQEKHKRDHFDFTSFFNEDNESSKQTANKSNVSTGIQSSRPAVPPGFSTTKPLITSSKVEVSNTENVGAVNANSTSILGKLMNNSLSLKDNPFDASPMIGADDSMNAQSSRFAQWFVEEATKQSQEDAKVSSVMTCEDVEQSILSGNYLSASSSSEAACFPVDNDASQHLLSLLHKGQPSPPKPLTLETLFGSAFMKELKSDGQNIWQ